MQTQLVPVNTTPWQGAPGMLHGMQAAGAMTLMPAPRPAPKESRLDKPLEERLKKKWQNDDVLKDVDEKLNVYATRHGGRYKLAADSSHTGHGAKSKGQAILDKMREEQELGQYALPLEEAANKALRSGLREYVDYAVDEVERFRNISKTGAVTADFDWGACGDHFDIPVLRRSHGVNRVDAGLEKAQSHKAGLGRGSDEMFEMDFLRDFCTRSKVPMSEQHCREQMAMAAHNVSTVSLFRADNGAPLYTEPDILDEILRPPPVGPYPDRVWYTEYSIV